MDEDEFIGRGVIKEIINPYKSQTYSKVEWWE